MIRDEVDKESSLIKAKIFKRRRMDKCPMKCVWCQQPLKELIAEIWWEERKNKTFHHLLHISCLYNFMKQLEHPKKEHKEIIKRLEEKYPKELLIEFMK